MITHVNYGGERHASGPYGCQCVMACWAVGAKSVKTASCHVDPPTVVRTKFTRTMIQSREGYHRPSSFEGHDVGRVADRFASGIRCLGGELGVRGDRIRFHSLCLRQMNTPKLSE